MIVTPFLVSAHAQFFCGRSCEGDVDHQMVRVFERLVPLGESGEATGIAKRRVRRFLFDSAGNGDGVL